jgi:hypothetical protein
MEAPDPMTAPAAPAPTEAVGVAQVPTWLLLAVLAVSAAIIWLVGFDNGQASAVADSTGSFLHEFFHDGRHLAGAPCH